MSEFFFKICNISNNSMKILLTVTLIIYENLVYCHLAAVIYIFSLSNKIRVEQMKNIGMSWKRNNAEEYFKSYNFIKMKIL